MFEQYIEQISTLFPTEPFWVWVIFVLFSILGAGIIKLILRLFSIYLRKIALKSATIWDDVGVDLLERLRSWVIFIWILFSVLSSVEISVKAHKIAWFVFVLTTLFQLALWGMHIIRSWKESFIKEKTMRDPASAAALNLLSTIVQVAFFVTLILIGLSNLGVNISALIAGLGVGGIAVALAAQNILGDLLASLSIAFDKPFVIGDFIITGAEKGTVEHIGIRTTRLRSLSGEELILPNKNLIDSRTQNYKRMWQRRVVQKFGVTYSTKKDVLEKIPVWVKEIISSNHQLQFDRCNLAAFGGSSLDFEFVFFVLNADYNIYMQVQEQVLLAIIEKFTTERVDFAFPSQSVYVEKMPT